LNGQLKALLRDAVYANTSETFNNVTQLIEAVNPNAAHKLRGIDPASFAMYTAYESRMQLLLMTTSNDAEQEFMRLKRRKIRDSKTPLQFFEGILSLWVDLLSEATITSSQLSATSAFLTSYAKEQILQRVQLSKKFTAEDSSVFCHVTAEDRQKNLLHHTKFKDIDKSSTHRFSYACDIEGNCECGRGWDMTGFYCEHCVALAESKGLLKAPNFLMRATHPIWRASTFVKCFPPDSRIRIPVVSELVSDLSVISISQNNRRGRPKKGVRKKRIWQEKGMTKKESRREYKYHRELYDTSTPVIVDSQEHSSGNDVSSSEESDGGYFSSNEDSKEI
jgi:hypothetical protein